MPLSRSVVRHLALLGADIRRIDTAEKALEWLSHRWDAQDYPVVPPGKSNDGTYPMSGDRGMSQMGGMPPMTPDAGMGGMGGMDYPMTPDGQPMYQDAEGNPMTQDAYMKALEDENNAMRQQLGQTADQELMTEMTPMAEEMDVPVDKTDSGYALAVKIASKAVGEQLHPENTPPAFIEGIIRKLKADRADSSAGREAGERAWIQGREDSQTPESRQRREDRRGSPEPGGEEHHRSLSDLALDQYRDSFKRRRDAARGVI